jgi:D-alanyl-D-alanine carboxypeptidase (penicillin-binding protein 5/6)
MKRKPPLFIPTLWAIVFFLIASPAAAQNFPELGSRAAVVMDAATGTIVYTKNPDEEIPPASLTKLMTMHLTFREIEAGRASLDEIFTPSREGWAVNQPPLSSLMGLAAGHSVSLRDLLLGMAIFSGNDAATATALRFAPSLSGFAEIMNREAAALGLRKTRFVDASGYSEDNMTTAREFAEFCRIYIAAHPYSIRDYHSVVEFAYPRPENLPEQYRGNPGTRLRRNSITLLGRVEGVDGLKTGFIFESGYNIALTAERNSTRFIAIILGGPSGFGGDRIRDEDGEKLINWAFANYKTIRPTSSPIVPFRVWKGKTNFVEAVPGEPLEFTALTERGENLSWMIEREEPLLAPLPAKSAVGSLVLYDTLGELRRIPLITTEEVERGGFFKRLFDSIRLLFRR